MKWRGDFGAEQRIVSEITPDQSARFLSLICLRNGMSHAADFSERDDSRYSRSATFQIRLGVIPTGQVLPVRSVLREAIHVAQPLEKSPTSADVTLRRL